MIYLNIVIQLCVLLACWLIIKRGLVGSVVMPILYITVALYTTVSTKIFSFGQAVPFDFYNRTSDEYINVAIFIFMGAAASYVIGLLLTLLVMRKRDDAYKFEKLNRISGRVGSVGFFCISLVSSTIIVLTFGISEILFRESYAPTSSTAFGMVLGRLILPVCAFSIGMINNKSLRYLSFSLNYLVFFGLASRAMLFVIFFYALSRFLRSGKLSITTILWFGIVALVSTSLALEFRSYEVYGIIPFISSLTTSGLDFRIFSSGLNYIFTYSSSYLGYMLENVSYDPKLFWIAINPLPSFMIDITPVIENSRVRANIPYSAIGELNLMLGRWYFLFCFLWGLFFGLIESNSRRLMLVFRLMIILFMVVVSLMSIQYNLRGFSRFFVYILVILISGYSLAFMFKFMKFVSR